MSRLIIPWAPSATFLSTERTLRRGAWRHSSTNEVQMHQNKRRPMRRSTKLFQPLARSVIASVQPLSSNPCFNRRFILHKRKDTEKSGHKRTKSEQLPAQPRIQENKVDNLPVPLATDHHSSVQLLLRGRIVLRRVGWHARKGEQGRSC